MTPRSYRIEDVGALADAFAEIDEAQQCGNEFELGGGKVALCTLDSGHKRACPAGELVLGFGLEAS